MTNDNDLIDIGFLENEYNDMCNEIYHAHEPSDYEIKLPHLRCPMQSCDFISLIHHLIEGLDKLQKKYDILHDQYDRLLDAYHNK